MFESSSFNNPSEASKMRGNDQSERNLFEHAYSGLKTFSDIQSLSNSQAPTESMQLPDFQITGDSQAPSNSSETSSASSNIFQQFPNLTIDDNSNSEKPSDKKADSGWMAVAKDFGQGMWTELTQHPDRVLENAVIGVGVAAAATLAAPEVAAVAGTAALAYAGYEVLQNGGQWLQNANVVANGDKANPQDLLRAQQGLQDMGSGATDVAAGAVGGMVTGSADSAITSAMKRAVTQTEGEAGADTAESLFMNNENSSNGIS